MSTGNVEESDKFYWKPGDLVYSQCALCKHLEREHRFTTTLACTAFPSAVPPEISTNQFDHRKPWMDKRTGLPGDMEFDLKSSILFEPAEHVDPLDLEALDRHFNPPQAD
jgi:hypothetical protein